MITRAAIAVAALAGAALSPAAASTPAGADVSGPVARLGDGPIADRNAAIDELAALAVNDDAALEALAGALDRERATSVDTRRTMLQEIDAEVPNKAGRFKWKGHRTDEQRAAEDAFDWLAELAENVDPKRKGFDDIYTDVGILRALAATRRPRAAELILDFAFTDEGLLYRDECGRRVRAMAPESLPVLIRATEAADSRAQRRYAGYQLERMDRESPFKAISAAAGDENLQADIIAAYGEAKTREAVEAVIQYIDHDSDRVRAAAREAWMGYVTGPPPPPAPKRKLKQPHGKESEEEQPLWLTYRELAAIELERAFEELFSEKPPKSASLEKQSQILFEHHDGERRAEQDAQLAAAKELVDSGDLAGATAAFDRLLATNPAYARRAEMAPAYAEWGAALEDDEKWAEAAAAYSKAHAVDPDADEATRRLAAHYYTLGKSLAADGKDGSAAYARAVELDPSYKRARAAAEGREGEDGGSSWMLYAGLAVGVGALLLLLVGIVTRRS